QTCALPILQKRLVEIGLGQEPAPGADRGPAELGRLHLEDLDDQHVARPRPAHPRRPGERVTPEGTARQHVGVRGGGTVVAVGRVPGIEDHRVARLDLEPRGQGVVPFVVHLLRVESMVHGAVEYTRGITLPRSASYALAMAF